MMSFIFTIVLIGQPIYEVDEVVVTAMRYPVELQDIALATMVIDKEHFDLSAPTTLSEILQGYTSLDIKDYGSPGLVSSIAVRGVPANGTLVLVDGVPLNSITAGIADLNTIMPGVIERIEVVKGPVSSLYGANAMGGVVNIITRKKHKKLNVDAWFSPITTKFDDLLQTKTLFTRIGFPAGQMDFDFAGSYSSSNGLRTNSDYQGYFLMHGFGYQKKELQLDYNIIYHNKEYGVPGPMLADSSSAAPFDREHDKNFIINLNFDYRFAPGINWSNKLFGFRQDIKFHTVFIGWNEDTLASDYDYLSHSLGYNTSFNFLVDNTRFLIGADLHYDTLRTAECSAFSDDTLWDASSYNIGGWLEINHHINGLIIGPSARFDHNSMFGNFFSPGIGVVLPVVDYLWVKASLGRAFRAPSFNDLFWPNSGNPDLKPEKGWAYEVRCEYSPAINLMTALSLFARSITDQIAWLPAQGSIWKPQNVNQIEIKGLELEVNSDILRFINVRLDFSYLFARQQNEELIYDYYDWNADTGYTVVERVERDAAFIPRYTASLHLNFTLPDNFYINLEAQYNDQRFNYYADYTQAPDISWETKSIASYSLFNLALHKDLYKGITFTLGIKNVLNQDYAQQFGNTMADLNYPMPGRMYFLRMTVRH